MDKRFIQKEIRLLLSSLQQFMKNMPAPKASNAHNKVQSILKTLKNDEDENELNRIYKDLKYNYNFLKLAYPKLLTTEENKPQETEQLDEGIQVKMSSYIEDFSNSNSPVKSKSYSESQSEEASSLGDSEKAGKGFLISIN
jgi:flagellin-specific chaperone FliS